MKKFIQLGVLSKTGMYLQLKEEFQENEQQILQMLASINRYRHIQHQDMLLGIDDPNNNLLRKSMLVRFPFMAKL